MSTFGVRAVLHHGQRQRAEVEHDVLRDDIPIDHRDVLQPLLCAAGFHQHVVGSRGQDKLGVLGVG